MGTVAIRLMDITGRRPAEVLPGLRAAGAFRSPHQVRFAAPYGPANYPCIPIPDQTNLHLDPIVKVVEALAVIQDCTSEQLTIPDPGQLGQQAGELLRIAHLLQARSLDATWSELTEPVATSAIDPHADFTAPAAVHVVMKPLVATIGDHHVVLGHRRITLASARVESITQSPDGHQTLLKWVSGEHDRALIEYIPGR